MQCTETGTLFHYQVFCPHIGSAVLNGFKRGWLDHACSLVRGAAAYSERALTSAVVASFHWPENCLMMPPAASFSPIDTRRRQSSFRQKLLTCHKRRDFRVFRLPPHPDPSSRSPPRLLPCGHTGKQIIVFDAVIHMRESPPHN